MKEASVNVSQAKNVKSEHVVGHGSKENCVKFHSNNIVIPLGGPSRVAPSASCYKTRLLYNSNVKPGDIEAILANRGRKNKKLVDKRVVKSMIFTRGNSAGSSKVLQHQCKESQENDCKIFQITDCDFTKANGLYGRDNCGNTPEEQSMLRRGGESTRNGVVSCH